MGNKLKSNFPKENKSYDFKLNHPSIYRTKFDNNVTI